MIEVRSDISYDVMHEAMTGFAVEKNGFAYGSLAFAAVSDDRNVADVRA